MSWVCTRSSSPQGFCASAISASAGRSCSGGDAAVRARLFSPPHATTRSTTNAQSRLDMLGRSPPARTRALEALAPAHLLESVCALAARLSHGFPHLPTPLDLTHLPPPPNVPS